MALTEEDRPPRIWQSILIAIVALAVIAHSVVIALWLMPDSSVRRAAGNERLTQYVNPYFQQSWKALDPRLQRVDEALEVRAVLIHPDTEKKTTTSWVDLVAADLDRNAGSLNRDRSVLVARRLAVNLNSVLNQLNEQQVELIAENQGKKTAGELAGDLRKAGSDDRAVSNYVFTERMVTRFATLFASTYWEGEIRSVQFRPGFKLVPLKGSTEADFEWWDIGRRTPEQMDRESLRQFDQYVKGRDAL